MPFIVLTKKDQMFKWTYKCEQSFWELKQRLTSAHILVLPTDNIKFIIYCDVSKVGLGVVLM